MLPTLTFIDVKLPGAQGRAWSKLPLAPGWERVISGNSCPKGLVEDANEMRVVKAKLEEIISFQDLDSTKPAGSVKIRVETIAHYLEKHAAGIIEKKKAAMPAGCPLPAGRQIC
jgi:hypothetical protein